MAFGNNRGKRGKGHNTTFHKRACAFCSDSKNKIDYKDHDMLNRHINEYGRIRPRRQTGVCAKHQRLVATAVKRARHIALLPFVNE